MSNQYVNKVVYNNDTLIDLTGDNVSASDVAQGVTFHLPSGQQTVGTNTGGNGIASITTERVLVYDFYSGVPDITSQQTLSANTNHIWGDATLHVGTDDMTLQYRSSGDVIDGITYHARLNFSTDGSPYISFTLSKTLNLKIIGNAAYMNKNATLDIYNADTNTVVQSLTKTDFTNNIAVTNQLPAGNYRMSMSYSSYTYVYFYAIKSTEATYVTRITITETNGTVTTFDIPDGAEGPAGPAGPAGADGAVLENTIPVHINVEASNWYTQLYTSIPNNTIGTVIFVDANDDPVQMPIFADNLPNLHSMYDGNTVKFVYHDVIYTVPTTGVAYSRINGNLMFNSFPIHVSFDDYTESSRIYILCTNISGINNLLSNNVLDLLTLNNGFLGLNETVRQNGLQMCKIIYTYEHGAEIVPVVNSQDFPNYNMLALPKLTINSVDESSIYTRDMCMLSGNVVDDSIVGEYQYQALARVYDSLGNNIGAQWNAKVRLSIQKYYDDSVSPSVKKTLIEVMCELVPIYGLTLTQLQDLQLVVDSSSAAVVLNLPTRYWKPIY